MDCKDEPLFDTTIHREPFFEAPKPFRRYLQRSSPDKSEPVPSDYHQSINDNNQSIHFEIIPGRKQELVTHKFQLCNDAKNIKVHSVRE